MNTDWIIDGLEVIARRRGFNIMQGDVIVVEAAIKVLKRRTPRAEVDAPKPVAYTIQSIRDGSIFQDIAIVGWHFFDRDMAELHNQSWVKAGTARVVPLYLSPCMNPSRKEE